ncbi:MAG: stalk domain-containing protein [Sphaerochaetaceae bacterium]
MKKILILLLVLVLIFGSGVFAEDIRVEVDGRKLDFDVAPTIVEGRTIIPARKILESLGLEVSWDDRTRTVTGVGQGTELSLVIGQRLAYVNGEPVNLDVAPRIIDDRSMVPVRFVAESTGAEVDWDNSTRTVLIRRESNEKEDPFKDNVHIEVDGGDLSGYRLSNVVVDIGYGERDYWAYTNEHGQLVRVVAAEIVLQDESAEDVLNTGRYFADEAKVPGTEHPDLDEGHVIADSLGGVSNAYNITPQNSTLNRHGDQAYMEKTIREAGGATNFEAIISYPDSKTQIPSHYKYTYTVWGSEIVDEFDNINPDDYSSSGGLLNLGPEELLGLDLDLDLFILSEGLGLENKLHIIRDKGMDVFETLLSHAREAFR